MNKLGRNSMLGGHQMSISSTASDRLTHLLLVTLMLGVRGLLFLAQSVANWPEAKIEFMPELVGKGPRKHMMFFEPGGNRIELIWPGV